MKRLIPLLFVLALPAAAASRAVGPGGATTQTANSAAGNHPTDTRNDGISLKNQCTVAIQVCAASGQTLSGGGTLVFWHIPETAAGVAVWSPLVEGTNPPMASATGLRCVIVEARDVAPFGRLYVEADTVTSSAGAITVTLTTSSCKGTQS